MYKAQQKAYTDGQCRKVLNSLSAVAIKTSPVKSQATTEYTGDQYPHICLMKVVKRLPLMAGHTFAEKNTLQICIGEEANLCNIKVKVTKSCKVQYKVACDNF